MDGKRKGAKEGWGRDKVLYRHFVFPTSCHEYKVTHNDFFVRAEVFRNFMSKLTAVFPKCKRFSSQASNKLGDYSLWASSAMDAAKETKFGTKVA